MIYCCHGYEYRQTYPRTYPKFSFNFSSTFKPNVLNLMQIQFNYTTKVNTFIVIVNVKLCSRWNRQLIVSKIEYLVYIYVKQVKTSVKNYTFRFRYKSLKFKNSVLVFLIEIFNCNMEPINKVVVLNWTWYVCQQYADMHKLELSFIRNESIPYFAAIWSLRYPFGELIKHLQYVVVQLLTARCQHVIGVKLSPMSQQG